MNNFTPALFGIFLTFSSLVADERTWKDATGQFSIQAELVGVKDNRVALKKTDGKTVVLPLSKLSKSDQQFVKAETAKQKEMAEKQIALAEEQKELAAKKRESDKHIPAGLHEIKYSVKLDGGGRRFKVAIDVIGEQAARAIAYGEIEVKAMAGGVELERCDFSGKPIDANQPAFSYIRRGEPGFIFVKSPEDRCIVWLYFKKVDGVTRIDSLTGSIEFAFADQIDWVDVKAHGTKEIAHPKLRRASVTPTFEIHNASGGGACMLTFPGPPKYAFGRLVDASGSPIKTSGGGTSRGRSRFGLSWNFDGKLPDDTIIQVSCEKPKTVKIPFQCENLGIEKAPAPKPSLLAMSKKELPPIPAEPHDVTFKLTARQKSFYKVALEVIGPQAAKAVAYGEIAIEATAGNAKLQLVNKLGQVPHSSEPPFEEIRRGQSIRSLFSERSMRDLALPQGAKRRATNQLA